MIRGLIAGGVLAVTLFFAPAARAQLIAGDPSESAGMSVTIGGGLGQFTDAAMRQRTGVTGEYEGRVLFGTRWRLGAEAAFVGTASGIDAVGLDENAVLISNGIEGLARLNFTTGGHIQPFVVGGVSWVRYSIVNATANVSDVRDRNDVFAVPFGGGVAIYVGETGFMADVRFTYRPTFGDGVIRPAEGTSGETSLSSWNLSLHLGYAF